MICHLAEENLQTIQGVKDLVKYNKYFPPGPNISLNEFILAGWVWTGKLQPLKIFILNKHS